MLEVLRSADRAAYVRLARDLVVLAAFFGVVLTGAILIDGALHG